MAVEYAVAVGLIYNLVRITCFISMSIAHIATTFV